MKKGFNTSAARNEYAGNFNRAAACPATFCRYASFTEELDEICGARNIRDMRAALERNGWSYTGQGKGNHMQYSKDGFRESFQIGGRDKDKEPPQRYNREEIREIYARALPHLFDRELVERAEAKARGNIENYRMAAHMIPVDQRPELRVATEGAWAFRPQQGHAARAV